MNKRHWGHKLSHSFFVNGFIAEMFLNPFVPASYEWHYQRFRNTDQYFEDLPDLLGCYCMGGEL